MWNLNKKKKDHKSRRGLLGTKRHGGGGISKGKEGECDQGTLCDCMKMS
jgi:hypothetical protein